MKLRHITWQSLRRRKAKAAFVLLGLAVGVGTMVALTTLAESMTSEINDKLEKYGANILITPKTQQLSLAYEGMNLGGFSFDTAPLYQKDLKALKNIKNAANIAEIGPMVLGPISVNGQNVLLAGVDFGAAKLLKPWWKINGRPPIGEQAVVGSKAAAVLGLSQGDVIEMDGRRFTASGILAPTGSQDDELIFTHLAAAQEVLNKPGLVSMVEVAALCAGCPIEDMVSQISDVLPGASVMAIQSVVKGRIAALDMFKRFSLGGAALVTLVGGLAVFVTMMSSVRERRREIGIFRAVGFRRSHVIRIIMAEAFILSLSAGVIGYAGGLLSAGAALPFLSENGDTALVFNPVLALAAVVLALVVGLSAGLQPALAAAGIDPAESLRSL